MNVSCPQCQTVFRVDPAKVPERGVRARCSVCSGLISVRRPDVPVPAVPAPRPPAIEPPPEEERPATAAPAPREAPAFPSAGPVTFREPTPPPMPEPALPPPPVEPETRPAAPRFTNPFLQQDPAARARRLARALVSDLVVYHPEKRQRGLAEGNLRELFSEEIRKSLEEYRDQVGDEVADTTPYFVDALNEILAEGQQIFG